MEPWNQLRFPLKRESLSTPIRKFDSVFGVAQTCQKTCLHHPIIGNGTHEMAYLDKGFCWPGERFEIK
jgi:hypothetical protein